VSLAERQALLARFLDDPEFEAALRADPQAFAELHGVEVDYLRWLARLEPRRVAAFRRGQHTKAARRRGET
jgi:hypothetical protein